MGTRMLVPAFNCQEMRYACVKLKFYFLQTCSSLICSVLFGVSPSLSDLVFVTPRQLTYKNSVHRQKNAKPLKNKIQIPATEI